MRKILLPFIVLFLLTGCNSEVVEQNETVNFLGYELPVDHLFQTLNTTTYNELVAASETFYLVVGDPT